MRQFRDTKYWVSEYGEIYSYWPEKVINQGSMYKGNKYESFITIPEKWKKLKQGNSTIYKKIGISINGKKCDFLIHRIVAECYLGSIPNGYEVDHIDSNPHNNHYTNLQYLTHEDNVKKAFIS